MFRRAAIIWGNKWTANYDAESLPMALHEWGRALKGLSKDVVDQVLDKCSLVEAWPMSMAEFLNIADEIAGIPSVGTLINNAIRGDFSHPLTKAVYDEIGSWAFRNDSEKDLIKKVTESRRKAIAAQRLNSSQKGIEDATRTRGGDQSRGNGMREAKDYLLS